MSSAKMQEVVEGDWKTFQFRQATATDFENIMELFRNHFVPDEPVCKLLDADDEYVGDFGKLIRPLLADNLTFLALDKASGQLVAVRVNFNHRKNIDWTTFEFASLKFAKLMTTALLLDAQTRLFEKHNLENYVSMLLTVVHTYFRRQGLATEMYRRTVAVSRAEGYFLANVNFSCAFARAAAEGVGFKEIARIPLINMKNENGELMFPTATAEHLLTQSVYIL